MPDESVFSVRRSRGLDSLLRADASGAKVLDNFLRDALKEQMTSVAQAEYDKYTKNWRERPKFYVPTPRVGKTGQYLTVKLKGNTLANQRWEMIDTKGSKARKMRSKKFKIVRRKNVKAEVKTRTQYGAKVVQRKITGAGTYKRLVPMPMRKYNSKIAHRGKYTTGDGTYEDITEGVDINVKGFDDYKTDDEDLVFRTKVWRNKVEPAHITRDLIAPVLRKEMTRVVENAYRRAFRAITGRGI